MRARTARLSAGLLALGLLTAAACGDDGDGDSTASEQSGGEATAATEPDAMAEADVVDTAVEAGDFGTLVTAVQAAGLEETLRGEGPYTVFAPTDAAFGALPAGTVDTLLADPQGDLSNILTYHVVPGEVLAEDVAGLDGQPVTTVNGATFTVEVGDDGSVSLTDAAGNQVAVTQTDVEASNGVIHVVDAVLMPG
ncbi:MAG TPA: fasciclin domain-containing protein [Acidimicrobiales bacterium]|nr:fasciclin domain-containing protein [Acidimicrobiales bacterium]